MIAALPLITSAASSLFGSGATGTAKGVASGVSDTFSSMLTSFSKDAVSTLKTGETMSVAGLNSHATTQSVVEAVMAAQEKLQTALAVRDKAVAAFQDVTRMSI